MILRPRPPSSLSNTMISADVTRVSLHHERRRIRTHSLRSSILPVWPGNLRTLRINLRWLNMLLGAYQTPSSLVSLTLELGLGLEIDQMDVLHTTASRPLIPTTVRDLSIVVSVPLYTPTVPTSSSSSAPSQTCTA